MIHARTSAFSVRSAGLELPGVLHLPAGAGPHPGVLLLHGFPGWERNFDLAQALRSAGFATLVFHYRGSWGAAGSWSWSNVLADSRAGLAALRTAQEVDAENVSVAGHSLGGFAALHTAAHDPGVRKVVSIAAFDLGLPVADPDGLAKIFDSQLLPLSGTSGQVLVAEMVARSPEWELARLAPQLSDRPVLLIGGTRDEDAPYQRHHLPLVAGYDGSLLEHHLFDTDHALSDHRRELAEVVIRFLQ